MGFCSHFQNELNCNAINPTRQSRPRLHPQPRHTLPSNTALHSDIHSDSSVTFPRNCKCLAKRLQRLRDLRVMYVVCCSYGCTFVLRRIRLHSVTAPRPSCPGPRVWIGDWLPTGGFLRLWVVVVVADVIYLPVVLSGISLWLEIDS